MAERISLLNWTNLNMDKDFSTLATSISTQWVVNWLTVSATEVSVWKAFIEVERTATTPSETFYVLFENTTTKTIVTWNNKYIVIEVNQAKINDWSWNEEDWTWIWEIKVVDSLPTWNYIELARTDWTWTVETTNRDILKGKWETAHSVEYIDWNWIKQTLALWTSWQVLTSNWATSVPSFTSPSVDINWLTEITTLNDADEFLVNQSWNKKITAENLWNSLKIKTTQSKMTAWEDITSWDALFVDDWTVWTSWRVYKTDASNTNKINFIWFATETVTSWNTLKVDTSWVDDNQTWLTIWSTYYLSNTPWVISTTPWTNNVKVWKSVSDTELLIKSWGETALANDVITFSRWQNYAAWDIVYNHNLWKIPKTIIFNCMWGPDAHSYWVYINTWINKAIWVGGALPNYDIIDNSNSLLLITWNSSYIAKGYVSNVTETTFTITWTMSTSGDKMFNIIATLQS